MGGKKIYMFIYFFSFSCSLVLLSLEELVSSFSISSG